MIQGYIPDWAPSAILAQEWHVGRPRKSLLSRTKRPPAGGRPVGAFRCRQCGYLEFYANTEFAPE
jgi:hypothetical protein